MRDLELLKQAYRSVDAFTQKQTWLPVELDTVWKQFGDRIQKEIIDPALSPFQVISSIQALTPCARLQHTSSLASWDVLDTMEDSVDDWGEIQR